MHVSVDAGICRGGVFEAGNSANPTASYARSDAIGISEADSEDGGG
jgi:hypothetical protein